VGASPKLKLTEVKVKNAKPQAKNYKLADGYGLYLLITREGGKHWRWKYRVNGREKQMAFGSWPVVTLAEARDLHINARRVLAKGIDPMAQRKAEKTSAKIVAGETFKAVAEAWYEQWKGDKNEDHAESVWRRINGDILPVIGHLPISKIETPAIVAVAKRIEARGASELARRAIGNIEQVYRFANVHGITTHNPTLNMKPRDVLKSVPTKNYARIGARELPDLLRKIDVYRGTHVTRIAILLLTHTFVRTSELIKAPWEEFDFKAKRWTIPAERMKGTAYPTPHIVPLATQTLALLETLHSLTGDQALLFPGERDRKKPMSNNTILKGLERMGYKGLMTGHGFRGLASTIMHEKNFDTEHINLQLGHMNRNRVSAAYNHAKYLPQRTEMMQWWANYLEKAKAQAPSGLFAIAG
jgi:integrase